MQYICYGPRLHNQLRRARLLIGVDSERPLLSLLHHPIMLRAQARASLRVLEQRGSLAATSQVQTASISSSAKLISSSHPRNLTPSPLASTTTAFPVRAMSTYFGESTVRPEPDKVLQDIADYVHKYQIDSDLAWETARLCLIDTIGCGLEGLRVSPECRNLLGPVVEGTIVPNGEPQLPAPLPPPAIPRRARTDPHIRRFRNQGPRDQLPARPDPRSVQHRHHHPLARLQRLLPRRRM